MKIIKGGESILKGFTETELTSLKRLITLKLETTFLDTTHGSGFMVFDDLMDVFGYEHAYIEFFFDRKEEKHGASKVVLYNGIMPDHVIDSISQMKRDGGGLVPDETEK